MLQGVTTLSAQPWWTAADAAELDLLTNELVRVACIHHDRCPDCNAARAWCPLMRDAYAALDEWRTGRILRSKAAHLRLQQNLAEWASFDGAKQEAAA